MHKGRRNSRRPFFAVDANAPRLSVYARLTKRGLRLSMNARALLDITGLNAQRPVAILHQKRSHATAPSCLTSRPSYDGIGNTLHSVKSCNRNEECHVITIVHVSRFALMRLLPNPAGRCRSWEFLGTYRMILGKKQFLNITHSKRHYYVKSYHLITRDSLRS